MHPLVGSLADIALRRHACGRVALFRSRVVRALLRRRSLGSAIPVSNLYKIPFRRPPALGWFVFRPVLPCQTGHSGLRGGQFGKAKRLLPATSWRPAGCAAGAWGACLCAFLYTQAAHASITASPSACQPPAFARAAHVCRPGALFRVASRGSQRAPSPLLSIYNVRVICLIYVNCTSPPAFFPEKNRVLPLPCGKKCLPLHPLSRNNLGEHEGKSSLTG